MADLETKRKIYCHWPPQVARVEELGYVEDINGCTYNRDIGCSSSVNGTAVFQFGDTFVHDLKGEFVGVSEANVAVCKNIRNHPTLCVYQGILPNGMIPVNPPLIDEDLDNDDYRTTTWCFGGIVWPVRNIGTSRTIVEGFTYFQNSQINKRKWEELFQHTGIAKVWLDTGTFEVTMSREPQHDVLFDSACEPKFGSFTAVNDGDYVYAYGHAAGSKDVMLARVPFQDIRQRSCYEYFDGHKYQKNILKCKPVMTGMQQGSIYRSKLFQPKSGKDWVFIGCNAFGDSNVQIGTAAKPEGPWEIKYLMAAPPINEYPDRQFTYCMYAHPWAFNEADGELMVTWSEGGMQGRVVAVKVFLAQNGVRKPEMQEKEADQSSQKSKGSLKSLKQKILGKFTRKKSLEDHM